jgi:hypothetical protein
MGEAKRRRDAPIELERWRPDAPMDGLAKIAEIVARKALLKEGFESLESMFLIADAHGEIITISADGPGAVPEKDALAETMRAFMLERGAVAYALVAEAWMAQDRTREELLNGPPPSLRPDRIEVVTIVAHDNAGGGQIKMLRMDRDAKGKLVDLVEIYPDESTSPVAGRFSNLLGARA